MILLLGGQDLVFELPENLILDLQVEEEDKRERGIQHSLEIEIKWFEGDGDGGAGGSLELG